MTSMIPINTSNGIVRIQPNWAGKALAIHKPVFVAKDGEVGFQGMRGAWCITHIHTGYRAGLFEGNLKNAIAFARQWDNQFGQVKCTNVPAKLRKDYLEALAVANRGPSKADNIEMGV